MLIKEFEKIVKKYGKKIAVKDKKVSITYKSLNEKANQIANTIISLEKKEETVLLLFEHGIDAVIAIMGTLKAKKIYVPSYGDYPENRIKEVLEDCNARIIITNNINLSVAKSLVDKLEKKIEIINVDNLDKKIKSGNLNLKSVEKNGAYIIYTSGSTGKPKGVLQSIDALHFYTKNYIKSLEITAEDKMTFLSSFCHDGTVEDVFPAFLSGATLYPLDIKKIKSVDEISKFLIDEKITIYHSVPSVFRFFTVKLTDQLFNDLRLIVMGAEALREDDIQTMKKFFKETHLMHMYGQTEASVNTIGKIDTNQSAASINLGKEFDGVKLLIFDENQNLAKENEIGEIYVASNYIAIEYWKNELESNKFFLNHNQYGRMYKTGDLGIKDKDGYVKFIGRKDFQIKIRGFRVELGEIENELIKNEKVKQAVVVDKGRDENKYLIAYLIADSDLNLKDLKENISKKLPEYMLPSKYRILEKFPVTLSGKVDRKFLKNLESKEEVEYKEASDDLQKALVKSYINVLKLEKIGVDYDFFELGGNSLLALELITELKKYEIVLKYDDIYEYKTVKKIASNLKKVYGDFKIKEIEDIQQENKKNNFKILTDVMPYDCKYTINELDCFYRPIAMLHRVFNKKYYDLFLLFFNFYKTYVFEGYFDENLYEKDKSPHSSFMRFYNDILNEKLNLELLETEFFNEESFHNAIQDKIDSCNAVVVGMDLFNLNYSFNYLQEHQGHYFIIKGYNREKKIYYILDNMHVKGGSSTSYEEFVVDFDLLYKTADSFYKYQYPESKKRYFNSLKKLDNIFNYGELDALLEIENMYKLINEYENKIKYMEEEAIIEIEKNKEMTKCEEMIIRVNWRVVYFDILFRLLYNANIDNEKIERLEEDKDRIENTWHDIRMKIFGLISEGKLEFENIKQEIKNNIFLEKKFREKYIQIIENENILKKIEERDKKNLKEIFLEKNNNNAVLIKEKNKIEILLDKGKNYDTWLLNDNSPQLLINYEEKTNFDFQLKHNVLQNKNKSHLSGTNSGIILKFDNGIKYLFGLYLESGIAILSPERTGNEEVYVKTKLLNDLFLRIEKIEDKINFYTREKIESDWEKIYTLSTDISLSYFGMFSRKWDDVDYNVRFSDFIYQKK